PPRCESQARFGDRAAIEHASAMRTARFGGQCGSSILPVLAGTRPALANSKLNHHAKETPMAHYVDGFVVPVPLRNLDAYRRVAEQAGKIWMEHGALQNWECIGDDVKPGKITSFPQG